MNIFLMSLIFLSLYMPGSYAATPLVAPASATNADIVFAINTADADLKIIAEQLSMQSSRPPGGSYVAFDQRTPWIEDFFDFFKYYELRHAEKESYLFYMNAPSQRYFTTIYTTARKNHMFLPPFSSYDRDSGLSKNTEKNYLYIYKLNSYEEFLKPTILDPSKITETVEPSSSHPLPRSGDQFASGNDTFNELIRTSAIQDMVFKHFYLYCPEHYAEAGICEMILNATNSSKSFSTSGEGTISPNAGINPESLLSQPSFATESTAHHRSRDYIRMISNPYPRNLVPFIPSTTTPFSYTADTTNIPQIAKNLTDSAYRGLSAHVLNEIKNRRIQSIDPDHGSQGSSTDGSLSQFEFMHDLTMDRMLRSNNWLTQMNVTSSEGLIRELVLIQASSLMMQYQSFRQTEHLEALLAAIVAQNQNLLEVLNFDQDTSKVQDSIAAAG